MEGGFGRSRAVACFLCPRRASSSVAGPQDFFTLGTEELVASARAARAKADAGARLMTRAQRERGAAQAGGGVAPRGALLRVRLPDGLLVQGAFGCASFELGPLLRHPASALLGRSFGRRLGSHLGYRWGSP